MLFLWTRVVVLSLDSAVLEANVKASAVRATSGSYQGRD